MEDREKIKDLLCLTQPVIQEVSYFKNYKPDHITKYILSNKQKGKINNNNNNTTTCNTNTNNTNNNNNVNNNNNINTFKNNQNKNDSNLLNMKKNKKFEFKNQKNNNNIVRNILFPNQNHENSNLRIGSLETKIEEMKKLFNEKNETLLNERLVMEKEFMKQRERDERIIKKLQGELQNCQLQLSQLNKDYFEKNNYFKNCPTFIMISIHVKNQTCYP
jgi:hypothetical protein